MKIVKFVKQLRKEIQEQKVEDAARKAEADAWNKAGRPTGPKSLYKSDEDK